MLLDETLEEHQMASVSSRRGMHQRVRLDLPDKIGVADVILLDGFDALGLPASLSSQSFYDSCHAALRSEVCWWPTC